MPLWKEFARRIAWLGRRSRFERELDDEFRFHLETRAEELQQQGLNRAAAIQQASREFGPRARACEETRSAWSFRWIEDLSGDLRYAARSFRRNPAFVLTAVFCLALGVGANTTMFSIAMEVVFSEPSCRDAPSLVQLRATDASYWPMREYRFLRDAHLFENLAGMNIGEVVNWRDGENSRRVAGTRVTSNFFEVTGAPVALGRPMQSGETHVAVLTHGFWTRSLGANPAVLGRKMMLDGQPYTVVGVLPRDHRNLAGFGFMPDLYLTLESSEYLLFARLPGGIDRDAAQSRFAALCRELDGVYPDRNRYRRNVFVAGVGGMERLRAEAAESWTQNSALLGAAFFGLLIAVTGLVLLIACANVSSLLLARAVSRAREFAIRASLGGSRSRILRQLLAESLLLAACGTGTGLLINLLLTKLMGTVRLSFWLPIEFVFQPDRRLLAYSVAVAAVVTIGAGLVPAIKATCTRINASSPWSFRNALVICQVAVSVVLLSGGWIFARNLSHAASLNPGFDTSRTVWATFRPVPQSCTPERFRALTATAIERLQAAPGLESAALARAVPLQSPYRGGGQFRPDTRTQPIHAQYNFNAVGPDYFRTMRIPVVQGRAFLDSDRDKTPLVAILNENLARRLFGEVSPIGHALRLPDGRRVTVVGVARNSKYFLLGEASPLAIYLPWAQQTGSWMFAHFLVRTKGAPEGALHDVTRVLSAIDPTAAVEVKTMRDALQFTLLPSRVGAAVLGGMALLGVGLASIGLYGVLVYAISRRMREIGVRVALGASPGRILSMVARESGRLVAAGLMIGTVLAVFAVRPLAIFLVAEVRPAEPMNFVIVAAVLLVVAALATVAPTIRALRIDPVTALRQD